MNHLFSLHFPLIARRYRECANKLGIKALFGLFFNFCINAPLDPAERIHCAPHVDWKNLAMGICVVFVYGKQYVLASQFVTDF